MTSLRAILRCIGVTKANVSVARDLCGFSRGRVPRDPQAGVTSQVSLNQVVGSIKGRHFHLNVVRVGYDAIPAASRDEAVEKLDYAVYKARKVFRQRSLGIGRVEHRVVSAAQADGADDIGSRDEAQDLWRSWSTDNDGIDAFVVRMISASDFIGLSPVGGDCDKGGKDDGLLAGGNDRTFDGLARTFAHELGHYLGLEHNHGDGSGCSGCPSTDAGKSNLMAQTRCTTCPGGAGVRDSTLLTSGQGSTIRGHCTVRAGC